MADAVKQYIRDLQREYGTDNATEHSYRPALQKLIESFEKGIAATNEPKRIKCGAPDFIVNRKSIPIGCIECKDIGVSLNKTEKTEQLKRYLGSLDNLILTDYLEFRYYRNGEQQMQATLAKIDAKGKIKFMQGGDDQLQMLFGAFLSADVQSINTPKDLAKKMALIAQTIRDAIKKAFELENEAGTLHGELQAFKETLLPGITIPEFADMYAQTVCYGMFSARVNVPDNEAAKFTRQHAAYDLPKTNPFLREMFEYIAGTKLDDSIVWAVDWLAELLRKCNMHEILRNFGKSTKQEDPVVHFYETFLSEYDPKMREARGVYYTPEPVVGYIVRSINHILKTEFDCEKGLADNSKIKINVPDSTQKSGKSKKDVHRVQILDPATGTGTFLHNVIAHIHESMAGNQGLWGGERGYVAQHLLPRLFGFELMMAPYAVAHMKLGLQLKETKYDFPNNERLGVYLTNTLEEAEIRLEPLLAMAHGIAREANAASEVKTQCPVMVVLGNPPYSNFGQMNRNKWILSLLDDYKKGLNEKKLNLDDDFIKFFKFAQHQIERTGYGILAFISNNTYIDGITRRRMRESLLETFDDIYILDLHGSSNKKETCSDGSKDKNVFDIQQGVSIGIFVKKTASSKKLAKVRHAEFLGLRKFKYEELNNSDITSTQWTELKNISQESCLGKFYFFVPKAFDNIDEYCQGWSVQNIFSINQNGVKTDRDSLFIDMSEKALNERMQKFYSPAGLDDDFVEKYNINNSSSYDILGKRSKSDFDDSCIRPILCRPFDIQWIYYSPKITSRPAWKVAQHMLAGKNLGFITTRQTCDKWDILASNYICGHKSCSAYDINSLFPLYLYPSSEDGLFAADKGDGPGGRRPNLSEEFIEEFSGKLGLKFVSDGCGDLKKTFGPEDVFHYMYAVFHSPTYRSRYAEFLKIDFPRVPLTGNKKLFSALCKLGKELVGLHLLEEVPAPGAKYPVAGDNEVDKPRYVPPTQGEKNGGRVFINKTQYFENIPEEVWNFHVGGYQVCEKWLKDRKGRILSFDEIEHYSKTTEALKQTIRLMAEIDKTIPNWPIE